MTRDAVPRPRFNRPGGADGPSFRTRLAIVYGTLAMLNVGGWLWAFAAFHDNSMLLGVALLVYGLGLRHAVDPDHIAAIDNVTRKLMHEGQRPVSVGFFFAIGHSIIVVFMTAAIAGAATMLGGLGRFREIGGIIGTSVSALFLFVIAAMNIAIFISVYRCYHRVRRGGAWSAEDFDPLLNNGGLLARMFRPLFRLVDRSWHMMLLGLLFGLGFDTATEVAMFSMSATQTANGIPLLSVMVYPLLFAGGMSLVDTSDGVAMLGVYNWAFVRPLRKLWYNMTITLMSVAVALMIGGIEALGLVSGGTGSDGAFWDMIAAVNNNFNYLGFVIIGSFLAVWIVSWLIYRLKRPDGVEVGAAR